MTAIHEETIQALKEQAQPMQLDDTMSEAARKALLADFIQMLEHEDGSRTGEDIEQVHDMRVATRRMRSIFALLDGYFKPKTIAPYQRGLRQIARVLGAVRDLDVMIDNLQQFEATLDDEQKPLLQPVIALLDKRRVAARKKLIARLDRADYQRFVAAYGKFLTTPGEGAVEAKLNGVSPKQIRFIIPVIVYEHLAAVRAYDTRLNDANPEVLHELRIEFKRLRYLVSMYEGVLGTQAGNFIKALKAIQDQLGLLNDAAVAQEQLNDLLPDLKKKQAKLIKAYIATLAETEAQIRADFPDVWRKFNTKTVQRQLANAVAGL
jgi:CHAD domain-containing protein